MFFPARWNRPTQADNRSLGLAPRCWWSSFTGSDRPVIGQTWYISVDLAFYNPGCVRASANVFLQAQTSRLPGLSSYKTLTRSLHNSQLIPSPIQAQALNMKFSASLFSAVFLALVLLASPALGTPRHGGDDDGGRGGDRDGDVCAPSFLIEAASCILMSHCSVAECTTSST